MQCVTCRHTPNNSLSLRSRVSGSRSKRSSGAHGIPWPREQLRRALTLDRASALPRAGRPPAHPSSDRGARDRQVEVGQRERASAPSRGGVWKVCGRQGTGASRIRFISISSGARSVIAFSIDQEVECHRSRCEATPRRWPTGGGASRAGTFVRHGHRDQRPAAAAASGADTEQVGRLFVARVSRGPCSQRDVGVNEPVHAQRAQRLPTLKTARAWARPFSAIGQRTTMYALCGPRAAVGGSARALHRQQGHSTDLGAEPLGYPEGLPGA